MSQTTLATLLKYLFDPIDTIADAGGPINLIFSSARRDANVGFSDKNPYPG